MIGPSKQTGGGEQHPAGIVGDFQWGSGSGGRDAACSEQDRAAWSAVLLGDLSELIAHQSTQLLGVFQDFGELGDSGFQLATLGLQLDPAESRKSAQRHLEDVVGLDLRQLES